MWKSAAIGLLAGRFAAAERLGNPALPPPPRRIGALLGHITGGHIETIDAGPRSFQPMNVNFGLFPPLAEMPTRDEAGQRLRGPAKTIAKKQRFDRAGARPIWSWPAADADRGRIALTDRSGHIPAELAGRFRSRLVLKQDVFSTVERGSFLTPNGEVEAVMRRIDLVPWWSAPIARHFLSARRAVLRSRGHRRRAAAALSGKQALVRGWIDGLPMQSQARRRRPISGPRGVRCAASTANADAQRSCQGAKLAAHPTGYASLTDFQLATRFARAAPCSAWQPMKTCGTCSNTNAAMRRIS